MKEQLIKEYLQTLKQAEDVTILYIGRTITFSYVDKHGFEQSETIDLDMLEILAFVNNKINNIPKYNGQTYII